MAIPLLRQRGIVGKDMHKPDRPGVPEMGGMLFVVGFAAGIITMVAFNTFLSRFLSISLVYVLAAFSVVMVAALIGIIDDLMRLRQGIKAITPLFAAFPLVAVRAGDTSMSLPFLGQVDFGIIYSLVLVPLGVAGAANAVNMLAGFNGEEAGVGMVAVASLAAIAYLNHETAAFLLLIAALGALLATLYYNWYPSKIFIGDVGTLSIGGIIASAVIMGNFELAGIIVIIPYAIDFVIKAKNRFPTSSYEGSWAIYRGGKLYCPETGPVGLGLLIVKLTGGTRECNVALILMGLEAICGGIAIWLFW
jgi:UDP-N-acetylglucosamine--dolichyl-phosphate N-acetylglucosaminephosphotransferase